MQTQDLQMTLTKNCFCLEFNRFYQYCDQKVRELNCCIGWLSLIVLWTVKSEFSHNVIVGIFQEYTTSSILLVHSVTNKCIVQEFPLFDSIL